VSFSRFPNQAAVHKLMCNSNAILDASDLELVADDNKKMGLSNRRVSAGENLGGFFEKAILLSLFSVSSIISDRCPRIWSTPLSRWDGMCFWRSRAENNQRATSRQSIRRVLSEGSYEQCRFVMEHLLPLRIAGLTTGDHRFWSNEKSQSQEDGVLKWTRCPLSAAELDCLLQGNIKMPRPDRQPLWDAIEAQRKMGQPASVSYLHMAILHGNTDALEEMLRRGWNANGPWWGRLRTPFVGKTLA
jgi:hypothetical protein